LAKGTVETEGMSADYIVALRNNLTEYFMGLKMDETTANAAALETMGMNE
jgi:hypothetical protein